jgi:glyoxylase-like metal-dependent hydrolase (beta-lactamase superfamily II)
MKRLSESLYLYEDTCNVYVVVRGDEAVLIDFGGGAVLDMLPDVGVKRVTAVFMTHHHRDQGQGLPRAVLEGIPIYVPHTEQDLFANVDEHWQAREIRNNYNVRQDRFSLLSSVPIAGTLKDYATVSAAGYDFAILPTPGHTTGSISLFAEIDGASVAFTGDLIYAPGKVWSMAATQWTYNGAEGAAVSIPSLLDVKERCPAQLLPSHGLPMDAPSQAIDELVERLWSLLQQRKQNPRLFQLREKPYEEVLPHLLKSRASMSNYYVVLSKSGKALLIDFGYDFLTGIPAGADRASRRPWLYNINRLKREYDIQTIDVVLLTHYHDDHVAGCNVLRDVEGTEVWAAENFADILERPSHYDLPCLWYDPIPVDRVLPLAQTVRWEEFEFTLYAQPGHTLYAVAIDFECDGKRVLAIGDQYQGNDGLLWNYVYQNRFQIDDYAASAALYRKLRPDVLVSGHWDPVWVEPDYFDRLKENGEALRHLHEQLLPGDIAGFGAEGFGARITPYQQQVQAGGECTVQVEITNPFGSQTTVVAALALPEGWKARPESHEVPLEGYAASILNYTIVPPGSGTGRRARIAVDMTAGGRRFGQQAEALIDLV